MGVKVKNNFGQAFNEIEKKAQRFVAAAVSVAGTNSLMLAPREYGTLANSQFQLTRKTRTVVKGILGYNVSYAKYLNGVPGQPTPTWKPRPVDQKKGPSTNMKAEPGFLNKGFESPTSRRAINTLAKSIMKV